MRHGVSSVHLGSFGSFRCAVGVVGFTGGALGLVGLIGVRCVRLGAPWCRQIHSVWLGLFRRAKEVVRVRGFIWARPGGCRVHYGSLPTFGRSLSVVVLSCAILVKRAVDVYNTRF